MAVARIVKQAVDALGVQFGVWFLQDSSLNNASGIVNKIGDDLQPIEGTSSDAAWNGSAATVTRQSLFRYMAIMLGAPPLPISTTSALDVAPIAAGGTAQPLFGGVTPVNGFEVINLSTSETLYCAENSAAAVAGPASIPIGPMGSYNSPKGYKPTGAISVIGATTGHAKVARSF